MDPQLLTAIITKAKSECEVTGVGLFNWTEPILHPRLPELIRIVESNGIFAENPYAFRISASGFTQDVYGYTHRGDHPDPGFEGVWAFMMPLEKILAYVNDDPTEALGKYLTSSVEELQAKKYAHDVRSLHAPWRPRLWNLRRTGVRRHRRAHDRARGRPPHRLEGRAPAQADAPRRRMAVPAHGGQVSVPFPSFSPPWSWCRRSSRPPAGGPFPSDRFTALDLRNNTLLRVNLPRPDCAVRVTDCADLDVINTLDGFNLQLRLSSRNRSTSPA